MFASAALFIGLESPLGKNICLATGSASAYLRVATDQGHGHPVPSRNLLPAAAGIAPAVRLSKSTASRQAFNGDRLDACRSGPRRVKQ